MTNLRADYPRPPQISELKERFKDVIVKMRELLQDVFTQPENQLYDNDVWMIRFLFNPKYTVEQCAERYRKMIAKRKEDGFPQILANIQKQGDNIDIKTFPHFEIINKAIPESLYHSKDGYGQPVAIQLVGMADIKLLLESVTKEQFYEYAKYKAEYMRVILDKLSEESGNLLQWIQVIDLDGLGMKHFNNSALDMVKFASNQIDQMYKECLGKVHVINAPRVFHMIWAVMKLWVAERTVQKVALLGNDYKQYFGEIMVKSNWPTFLGGEQSSGIIGYRTFDASKVN